MTTRPNTFLCDSGTLLERIDAINPQQYDKTRNYLDGAVTWLSPFVTHGIIDTTTIAKRVLHKHSPAQSYRLLYELAWREYFHRTWQLEGDAIFQDLIQTQADVASTELPVAILEATTGIDVLDESLTELYTNGTLHNHARMWLAGVIANHACTHWKEPARWLHYHLLDGDLASNTLSWQWVAGTFSHKRYIANQDNINRYSRTTQKNTWLDLDYEQLAKLRHPAELQARAAWLKSSACTSNGTPSTASEHAQPVVWPATAEHLDTMAPAQGTVALRSLWNLSPDWQADVEQHWLFVDTDWLAHWPISHHRWQFIEHHLPGNTRLVIGNLFELNRALAHATVQVQEYPACRNWPGTVHPRRWLYDMPPKPFTSFSQFWKQVRGQIGL